MTNEIEHTNLVDFETLYLRLRQQEGRVYTDEELRKLPLVDPGHPHYWEWLVRRRSSARLVRYFERKKQAPHILEIGCGNGWLSHNLAWITGSRVIGVDVNFTELQQAARVFQHLPNLHFIYTDIRNGPFSEKKFDAIVFAASIQYFESLDEIFNNTLKLLRPGGEIHILDSPFYTVSEIKAARQRTRVYYEQAGFPAMTGCYFHHSLSELQPYTFNVLYDPGKWINRLLHPKYPFYWIRITN